MPKLTPAHRRALELRAGSPAGMTDSLLLAHGITRTLLAELVLAGLVSAEAERMIAGDRLACAGSRSLMPVAWRLNDDRLPTAADRLRWRGRLLAD